MGYSQILMHVYTIWVISSIKFLDHPLWISSVVIISFYFVLYIYSSYQIEVLLTLYYMDVIRDHPLLHKKVQQVKPHWYSHIIPEHWHHCLSMQYKRMMMQPSLISTNIFVFVHMFLLCLFCLNTQNSNYRTTYIQDCLLLMYPARYNISYCWRIERYMCNL